MKTCYVILSTLISTGLFACSRNPTSIIETATTDTMKLKVTVGSAIFTATLLDNASVAALKAKLPMTMNMKELNGNEKYYDLSENLPRNASNPQTIQTGDLMLYGSNTIVLFYKTFPTSYSYTRLGRIDNPSGLAEAQGSGDVMVKFELEKTSKQ